MSALIDYLIVYNLLYSHMWKQCFCSSLVVKDIFTLSDILGQELTLYWKPFLKGDLNRFRQSSEKRWNTTPNGCEMETGNPSSPEREGTVLQFLAHSHLTWFAESHFCVMVAESISPYIYVNIEKKLDTNSKQTQFCMSCICLTELGFVNTLSESSCSVGVRTY